MSRRRPPRGARTRRACGRARGNASAGRARYAERYPAAHVVAPASVREKVEEVVRVDLTTDEFPNGEDVTMLPLAGVAGREFVMQVRSDDGVTLVFNDALFNVPHTGGAGGWMLRLMGSSGGPRATPLARMLLYTDRSAAVRHSCNLRKRPIWCGSFRDTGR